MGSTASGEAAAETPVKVKKDSGKKKPVRKAAPKKTKSQAAPVKKKAAARKKAAAPKKATASKRTTAKKKASRKPIVSGDEARSVHTPDNHDIAPVTGTAAGPGGESATDAVPADSRSLSWMAAQAASALKAVKANQSVRAQALLANAEITPATPVRTHKDIRTLFTADAPEAPAVAATEEKTPAEELSAPSAAVPAEPAAQETVEVPVARVAIVKPEAAEDVREKQLDTLPPHVIAHTSATTGSRRLTGPILLTGIVILIGALGVRVWFSGQDTADIAAVQESAGIEQASPVTVEPQQAVISVVTSEPEDQPATAATPTTDWSPSGHPEWPVPDQGRESQPEVAAAAPETSPQEAVVSEPRQVQATTQNPSTVSQAASPGVPQAGYYAPAYGYYPQQPVRQQPYYRPAYAQPSYRQ